MFILNFSVAEENAQDVIALPKTVIGKKKLFSSLL